MTFRALLVATATSAVLLGCETPRSAQLKGEATFEAKAISFAQEYSSLLCASSCTIRVTVLENCSFRVTPWTLGVPTGVHNVPIHWRIDASSVGNARFAPTRGVFFKNAASSQEFDGERRLSDTQFLWNDKNPSLPTKGRPHPYGINVVQWDKPCPTFDPTVVNDY